jgi:serine/threonine protein kinase
MLFLVQNFVPGKNLNQHMQTGTKFTPSELYEILSQALKILKYIHELSPPVVHRDLHPRNLIWDDSGKVYLIDFGAMQDRLRFEGEMGSTSVGTFGFIPLEQSMGRAQPSSDLYALGMTMLALISGRAPHELPVDEQTGKVRVDTIVQDRDLRRVLNAMVEPIAGNRVKSAEDALQILISRNAVVHSKPTHLVKRDPVASLAAQRIYTILVGTSVTAAAVIYLGMFNALSETQMVQIAPFWFVPLALGVSGKLMKYNKNPYVSAAVACGIAVAAFFVFLFGIFPGM